MIFYLIMSNIFFPSSFLSNSFVCGGILPNMLSFNIFQKGLPRTEMLLLLNESIFYFILALKTKIKKKLYFNFCD